MLSDELIKRLEGIEDASKKGYPICNLYRLMCEPRMWIQAYSNMRANNGALTPGISKSETIDGFSIEKATILAQILRNREYKAKPVRRINIPKKDGRTRPLGIPCGNDKLTQEVARMILERVYEPIFSDRSHGFRPKRSCQTALSDIKPKWNGVKWIIDVDIKGFFDNIPHKKLLEAISKKVNDRKFIDLIDKWLKAGYVENWKHHKTWSGTPQGGIISPLLANIYLHELDNFIEELIVIFNKGKVRRANPERNRLTYQIHKLRKMVDIYKTDPAHTDRVKKICVEINELLKEKRQIPSQIMDDSDFKRMYYTRYADDFVIGIIGSKKDAVYIANLVKDFITSSLNLEVNEEKTRIRHVSEGTNFLSYEIRSWHSPKVLKQKIKGRYTIRRTTNSVIQLFVPNDIASKFCKKNGYGDFNHCKATHRTNLLQLSDAEIIMTYNAELRGLANYYTLATDMKYKLNRLYFIWQTSLFKTLANKHKSKVTKIVKMLKQPNGEYVLRSHSKSGIKEIEVLKLKHIKRKSSVVCDNIPVTAKITTRTTEIVQRLLARQCEYCGKSGQCEVHHVKKLKDLQKRNNGKPLTLWQLMMIARKRKTLILCLECHRRLHTGTLPDLRQCKGINKNESITTT